MAQFLKKLSFLNIFLKISTIFLIFLLLLLNVTTTNATPSVFSCAINNPGIAGAGLNGILPGLGGGIGE